jgi:hypothetical protein
MKPMALTTSVYDQQVTLGLSTRSGKLVLQTEKCRGLKHTNTALILPTPVPLATAHGLRRRRNDFVRLFA